MTRLPILKPREVIQALEKAGFLQIRQKGSHVFLEHPDGRTTLVPLHKGRDIDRNLLSKILKDAKLNAKEFRKLL